MWLQSSAAELPSFEVTILLSFPRIMQWGKNQSQEEEGGKKRTAAVLAGLFSPFEKGKSLVFNLLQIFSAK